MKTPSHKRPLAVLAVLLSVTLASAAWAAPDDRGGRGNRDDRPDRSERIDRGDRHDNRDRARPGRPDNTWFDGAHGHNRRYLPPGRVVVLPPRPPAPVWWGGVGYRHWDGYWATSGPRGWITVRPPLGIIVRDLPSWRTAVVIGGLTYLYVNGVYYRDRDDGSYEVVPPPVAQGDAPPPDKTFVYPRQGQSAQQQEGDEYECHRWAATQAGFDPSNAATGQGGSPTSGRSDYQRARVACLEGRGYTVR